MWLLCVLIYSLLASSRPSADSAGAADVRAALERQRQPDIGFERCACRLVQPAPAAVERNLPVLHQDHAVERLEAEIEIVADDDNTLALRHQIVGQRFQPRDAGVIQPSGWLIQHQHIAIHRQHCTNRHQSPERRRQIVGVGIGELG